MIKSSRIVTDYVLIVAGSLFMAFSITCIFDTMSIVPGGISGIAIIVKDITRNINVMGEEGIPLWITNLTINIPLFILSGHVRGRRFLFRTFVSTAIVTVALGILPDVKFLPEDDLLNTIIGGTLMGAGLGLVFSAQATTGGTDLCAMLLNQKFRHLSIPYLLALVDGIIVLLGAVTFGIEKAMYSTIAIIIATKVADIITDGPRHSKMAYIISDFGDDIADRIFNNLDRGVTGIHIMGMYTKKDKTMLMCVLSKKEMVVLKELVADIDSNAFLIVSDVNEALGEGFLSHSENLIVKKKQKNKA